MTYIKVPNRTMATFNSLGNPQHAVIGSVMGMGAPGGLEKGFYYGHSPLTISQDFKISKTPPMGAMPTYGRLCATILHEMESTLTVLG